MSVRRSLKSADWSHSQSVKPLRISSILMLACCIFSPVAYLYLFPLAVDQFAGFFGDVRNRVVQGVFHQVQPGITAKLSLNGILVLYLDIVLVFGRNAELVQIGDVTDLDLRFEEPRGVTVVDTRRYPPLAEVEVQIFKSDGLGRSLSQCREGSPVRPRDPDSRRGSARRGRPFR